MIDGDVRKSFVYKETRAGFLVFDQFLSFRRIGEIYISPCGKKLWQDFISGKKQTERLS